MAEYPRPPFEAYLPETEAPLKPCQTVSPGVHQSKSPLGYSHCIIIIKPEVWIINHCLGLGHETMVCAVCLTMFLWKMLYLKAVTTVSELSPFHTLSQEHWENKAVQNSPHHENLPKCETLESPNTNKQGKNSSKAGGMTDTHIARRFTRMRVWLWNGSTYCAGVAAHVTSGLCSVPHGINFAWEALLRVPRLLLSAVSNGENI